MVMPISNDQQISNGGVIHESPRKAYWCDSKVYFAGAGLTFNTASVDASNGYPYVTLADYNDLPVAFAYLSTVDTRIPYEYQNSDSYVAGKMLSCNRFERGQVISVPMHGGHQAIVVGDKIGIRAYGEYDKFSSISGATWSVGYAMRDMDADTGSVAQAGIDAECLLIWVDVQKEA